MSEHRDMSAQQIALSTRSEMLPIASSLQSLARGDVSARAQALYTLFDALRQQEQIGDEELAAVPLLINLLADPGVQVRGAILMLLAHMARRCAARPLPLPASGASPMPALLTDDVFSRGLETYLALLTEDEPEIRMNAVYLLACLRADTPGVLLMLRARLEVEQEPRVRASLLLSCEELDGRAPTTLRLFKEKLRAGEEPLVRLVAALALVRQMHEQAPARALRILVNTIARPDPVANQYDELPWASGSVISEISHALTLLRPERVQFAIPILIQALESVGVYSAMSISQALLHLAFRQEPTRTGSGGPELTGEQRLVLDAIKNSLAAWNAGGALESLLQSSGLPDLRWRLAG